MGALDIVERDEDALVIAEREVAPRTNAMRPKRVVAVRGYAILIEGTFRGRVYLGNVRG